jgi:hypothetical protein
MEGEIKTPLSALPCCMGDLNFLQAVEVNTSLVGVNAVYRPS